MQNDFLQSGKAIKIEMDQDNNFFIKGIIQYIEKDILTVQIDSHYIQKKSQVVNCTITNMNKTKVCMFKTIIKSVDNNTLFLDAPNKEDIQIIQRREYVRIQVDKEVNCYLVGIYDKKIESTKIFPAILKDISGGGVLLNSSLSLPKGTVLLFDIKLDNMDFLLAVEVLRNIENEADQTKDLGCRFIGLDEGERQKIIAYCNKEQLILKRRRKITG